MLATRMINPENKSWTTLYTGSNVFAASMLGATAAHTYANAMPHIMTP